MLFYPNHPKNREIFLNLDVINKQTMKSNNYFNNETKCELAFNVGGPYYHLYSSGIDCPVIFRTDEDYKLACNMIPLCLIQFPRLSMITFQIMSNHVHMIIEGEESECIQFFNVYKKRLKYLYAHKQRPEVSSFTLFNPSIVPISDLRQMREEIVYVNRNGYLVDSNVLPHNYLWGSGYLMFNSIMNDESIYIKCTELPARERRSLFHIRDYNILNNVLIFRDMISPLSFCSPQRAESFFRNAHHYFNMLSKNYEAYSEVSKRIGEQVCVTDDELYYISRSLSQQNYGISNCLLLSPNQKIELSKKLYYDYYANKKQISRFFKIEKKILDELF